MAEKTLGWIAWAIIVAIAIYAQYWWDARKRAARRRDPVYWLGTAGMQSYRVRYAVVPNWPAVLAQALPAVKTFEDAAAISWFRQFLKSYDDPQAKAAIRAHFAGTVRASELERQQLYTDLECIEYLEFFHHTSGVRQIWCDAAGSSTTST